MQRINKFMRNEELDPTIVERSFRGGKNVVEVEGGNFRWNKDAPAENETGVKIKEQPGLEPGNGQSVTTGKERKDAQSDDAFCLNDISLKVAKGSLCAVVGVVGSGKSSLLNALLGEMEFKLFVFGKKDP